jgi:translation initiation factor 2B subunit (eIF-2B alpha/beta/delta family)
MEMAQHHDDIARLKAEARHFRDLAAKKRKELAALKARPISQRDPIAAMHASNRVTEYVRAAQGREAFAANIRAAHRTPKAAS